MEVTVSSGRIASRVAQLEPLLEQLPLGVVIAQAPDGRVVYANPAVSALIGPAYTPPTGVTSYGSNAEGYDQQGRKLAAADWPLARALQQGEIVRRQVIDVRRHDGRRWLLAVSAAPFLSSIGEIEGAIAVFEDETATREADAFRAILLEGLSDVGLGVLVSDGRQVLSANDAFGAMMRTDAKALVGLDTTLLVVPEERAAGRARQDARLSTGAAQTFRCHFQRADGTRFLAEVVGKPLRADAPRFLALVRDLTEEETARAEIEAARRQVAQSEKLSALGSLVSGVAHEVRTPLTYLHTNLALLQRRLERALAKPAADPELAALLPEVASTLEATERIERLVDDLRRYTRLRAGEPRLAPLDASVRRGVDLFRATHRGAIDLRAEVASTPGAALDELAAQQVVLNLLSNAAEASPPGAPIVVRTRVADGRAVLEVADQGPGIAPEVLARAFDPFFTTKPHGTGLGLSIVKRIVEEAGGAIEVETAPGRGTTFRVVLPATAPGERQGI